MPPFSPTKIWDVATCFEMFAHAVDHQQRAIMRGAIDQVVHEHHIRFRRHSAKGEAKGIWVDILDGDSQVIELEYTQKMPVEVSFGVGEAMAFFDTVFEQRLRPLFCKKKVLLRAPNSISVLQQRKDGRIWVPDYCQFTCRLAKMTAETPTPGDESDYRSASIIQGRIWDLSLSGAGFICPTNPVLMKLRQDDRLEFEFEFAGTRITRTAGVCYMRPLSSRSVRLGVQFVKDPPATGGDEDLNRILQGLQSAKARAELYDETLKRMAG